jgi:hypothetical protein
MGASIQALLALLWAGDDGRVLDLAVQSLPSESNIGGRNGLRVQFISPDNQTRVVLRAREHHDVHDRSRGRRIVVARTGAERESGKGWIGGLEILGLLRLPWAFCERDEAPTGADIRTSRLDAPALKLTISCGRPGGAGMPAFDEGAYKVRACYGRGLGPPPDDLYPTPRPLTPEQIDAVVSYLQARIVGRGRITRAECMAYYDEQEDMCEDYK